MKLFLVVRVVGFKDVVRFRYLQRQQAVNIAAENHTNTSGKNTK